MSTGKRLPWRRWNAALHRDLGYLAAGLTIVYAVSGLAVNHMAHWNPNYRHVVRTHQVGPLDANQEEPRLVAEVLARLKAEAKPKGSHQPDPETLEIYVPEGKYAVDLPTGQVIYEANLPRPVLTAMNRLHLNAPKRAWTWIADLYALGLLALALSGLFILKGPNGLRGRGAWLTAAGCAVPTLYWIWWAYLR